MNAGNIYPYWEKKQQRRYDHIKKIKRNISREQISFTYDRKTENMERNK